MAPTTKNDDYANLVTGLGGPIDKSQHGIFQREKRLWEPELNNMYEGSGLAARIIDRVVDDSTREGFRLEGSDKAFPWVEVASEIDDLGVVKVANKAAKTARLYGGGLLVMLTRDPGSMEDELDLANVSHLEGFQVFPSCRVIPDAYNSSFGTEAYSNPEWYLLSSPNATQTRVHRSRCVRVEGVPVLSPYRAMERGGWGPSVLERVAGELARLEAAEGYASGCMHDISVLTLKMPTLHAMMCGGDDQKEEGRKILEGIFWLRDNFHATLLDTEDTIEEVKRDLSGFGPLIEIFTNAVIREENMPRTILLGEQPGGLGSSSSDEVRGWYDHCAGWQERFLTPIYKRIMEVYFACRSNNGLPTPSKWVIAYDSLWQPDAQTQAQTLLTSAQAYQILILTGVMTPSQVKYEMVQKGLIKEGIEIPGIENPEEISPVDPAVKTVGPAQVGVWTGVTALLGSAFPAGIPKDVLARTLTSLDPERYPAEIATALLTSAEASGVPVDPANPRPLAEGQAAMGDAPVVEPEAMPSTDPVPADLCSTKEAAARLGIPTLTVNNMCRNGTLPYWGFGSHKQVSMADVLSLGKSHEMDVDPSEPIEE